MEKRWSNRNIDLALLTTCIGNFFKKKDFEAIKGKIPSGHQIFAEGSPHYKLDGYVSVTIEGDPDDFNVRFELCNERKKGSFSPILLTTMFLGGYFLKKKLRSEEDWMKLEKEFWSYAENTILSLNNSAENPSCSSNLPK